MPVTTWAAKRAGSVYGAAADVSRDDHVECRAHANQDIGTQPRRLPAKLSLKADCSSARHRHQELRGNQNYWHDGLIQQLPPFYRSMTTALTVAGQEERRVFGALWPRACLILR